MTSSGCEIGGNKSLIADLIDSQVETSKPVLKASALTDEDWLNLAVQYLKSGAKKPAWQILANPFYNTIYLKVKDYFLSQK